MQGLLGTGTEQQVITISPSTTVCRRFIALQAPGAGTIVDETRRDVHEEKLSTLGGCGRGPSSVSPDSNDTLHLSAPV